MKLLVFLGLVNIGLGAFNCWCATLGTSISAVNVVVGVLNLAVAGFCFGTALFLRD